jgi:hypothetical protein
MYLSANILLSSRLGKSEPNAQLDMMTLRYGLQQSSLGLGRAFGERVVAIADYGQEIMIFR